ncbi:hypothetical protein LINPERPRIM_LOCUS31005 [Linum perenne]
MLFRSKNMDRHICILFSMRLGMPTTQDLSRCLDVPILHERTSSRTYQGIIDKLDMKLTWWKAKSLSL